MYTIHSLYACLCLFVCMCRPECTHTGSTHIHSAYVNRWPGLAVCDLWIALHKFSLAPICSNLCLWLSPPLRPAATSCTLVEIQCRTMSAYEKRNSSGDRAPLLQWLLHFCWPGLVNGHKLYCKMSIVAVRLYCCVTTPAFCPADFLPSSFFFFDCFVAFTPLEVVLIQGSKGSFF